MASLPVQFVRIHLVLLVVGALGEESEGTGGLHPADVVVGEFDCCPFGFGSDDVAARRGPFEVPSAGLADGPGAVGFQPVATSAQAREIRLDGETTVLGVVVIERRRVVDVAEPRRDLAVGEAAVTVAGPRSGPG
ncbi:hypothetical protein [Rhodococcus sp. JVH1]|uniref:hypothetical protein n=1 Tax=Rhodococcus sp. JVH1 TaxID=745408 RepID=UPI0005C12EF6